MVTTDQLICISDWLKINVLEPRVVCLLWLVILTERTAVPLQHASHSALKLGLLLLYHVLRLFFYVLQRLQTVTQQPKSVLIVLYSHSSSINHYLQPVPRWAALAVSFYSLC